MCNRALIAAHIYASSWALGAPGLPKSPHQIRSLGLSVNTKQGRDGHSTWVNAQTKKIKSMGGLGTKSLLPDAT